MVKKFGPNDTEGLDFFDECPISPNSRTADALRAAAGIKIMRRAHTAAVMNEERLLAESQKVEEEKELERGIPADMLKFIAEAEEYRTTAEMKKKFPYLNRNNVLHSRLQTLKKHKLIRSVGHGKYQRTDKKFTGF